MARVVDALADGTLSENTASLKDYLLNGDGGPADPYLYLTDFASYAQASSRLSKLYQNQALWREKAVWNTACSGFFSSDRCIAEYNEKIWHLSPLE
ncbi:MAG TPA: glycogen/starch/alpha-glucan phosphorylase [Clostridiales bacterium]|nr:glycogen/starch/alpha-glucan phosphorylase [Clostridiales bacterium]